MPPVTRWPDLCPRCLYDGHTCLAFGCAHKTRLRACEDDGGTVVDGPSHAAATARPQAGEDASNASPASHARKLPVGWWIKGVGWAPTRAVLEHALSKPRGIGYFRIFGYGLHWKDTRRQRLLWSERNRCWVQWQIGPWLVSPLKRGERVRRGS